MPLTRFKNNLKSLHERIVDFNSTYRNFDKLKSLGWNVVPIIDVEQSSTWLEATSKIITAGYANYISNDWVQKPISITNHNLFQFDQNFLNFLNGISNEQQFLSDVDCYFNLPSTVNNLGRESRIYSKLACPDVELNQHSWCYSMSLKNIVSTNIPTCLKLTKLDAIVQFNSWFTDGHIETGGDDSVPITLLGEKLYFICTPGKHSINFEKIIRNSDDFMNFVMKAPVNSFTKENVKCYIPQPGYILCQPSLASHAVLTSTAGVSFVWGWEACNMKDSNRVERVLRDYGSGIRHEGFKALLGYAGMEGALQTSKELDKSHEVEVSGLSEHLYAFNRSGVKHTLDSSKRGNNSPLRTASKRMKRSFRLPGRKELYLARKSREQG